MLHIGRIMHKYIRIIKSKPFFIAMAFLIQLWLFAFLITWLSRRFFGFYLLLVILSFFVSVQVINRDSDSSSKLLWVLVIMFMPVFGGLLYVLFGARKIPKALICLLYTSSSYIDKLRSKRSVGQSVFKKWKCNPHDTSGLQLCVLGKY